MSMTIKKLAQERGCTVITTPYDTYTAARLINQSMPISYFMKTEKLITFDTDDFIDDIKDVMASKRFRHFPVLDKEGKYKGLISRRNLLGARGKNVILVFPEGPKDAGDSGGGKLEDRDGLKHLTGEVMDFLATEGKVQERALGRVALAGALFVG